MRRTIAFVFALVIMISFTGCKYFEALCLFYSDHICYENFDICINEKMNCCLVGRYICNEYIEDMEITIPDEYNGMPIKRIGGYVGRGVYVGFDLDISDLYINAPEFFDLDIDYLYLNTPEYYEYIVLQSTVDEAQYQVVDLPYVLNIGKNIDTIVNVDDNYYPHIEEDGSVVYYHPVVSINCSEENECFYSENGRLYNRKDNTLVEDFAYKD